MGLGKMLQSNTTIRVFDLAYNAIHNAAAELLGTAIGSSIVLEDVNLACCFNAPGPVVSILKGLSTNRSLKTLHLDGNKFGKAGWKEAGTALARNKTLSIFLAKDTGLDSNLLEIFLTDVVNANNSLEEVDISDNKVDLRKVEDQVAACKFNLIWAPKK